MKRSLLLVLLPALCVCSPASDPIPGFLSEVKPSSVEATVRKLASFGTRNVLSSTTDAKRGIGAAARWLRSELEKIPRLTVEDQPFDITGLPQVDTVHAWNVIATLKGTSDDVVVISGHYDSMPTQVLDGRSDAPGANDDGSGSAVVLEAARILSKMHPRATIKFAFFTGEEVGLKGSQYFAEQAKAQGWHIIADINNDIVGNSKGENGIVERSKIRVFSEGLEKTDDKIALRRRDIAGGGEESHSRQLARYIFEVAQRYKPDFTPILIYRRDRYGRGGDQNSFNAAGYAGIRFCEMNENFHHQHHNVEMVNGQQYYGDLPEFVDFDYLARVAKLNIAVVADLVLAPPAPALVKLDQVRMSAETRIAWKPVPGVNYVVRWRDTTSTVWQWEKSVGATQQFTTKEFSRDNYIFGVQSVDLEGHRSPVAIAE